jgi:surface antigen
MTNDNGGYSYAIKGYPNKIDANVLSNCVGYACGRFAEIIGKNCIEYQLVCNAENFIERAKQYGLKISDKPTLGGIMVWQKGATLNGNDGAGHVAIVEKIIDDNTIYTSESGYGSASFWNSTRTNNNGRWGMSDGYIFRGCIINPSIKEEKKEEKKENRNYHTLYNMYVRCGAGYGYGTKLYKDLTEDGKRNALDKYDYNYAIYKKGTVFTALEVITNNDGSVWAKTPSGYVVIKGASGTVYCERV